MENTTTNLTIDFDVKQMFAYAQMIVSAMMPVNK